MTTIGKGEFMELKFDYVIETASTTFSYVRVDINEDAVFEIRMYFGFDSEGNYSCDDIAMACLSADAIMTPNVRVILHKVAEEVEALHIMNMEAEAIAKVSDGGLRYG